uniref:Uncharacterized protein n=1 Tax=Arion vulgaris TaxID=1028688 RepID=A0A0B6ZXV5_9EUPU
MSLGAGLHPVTAFVKYKIHQENEYSGTAWLNHQAAISFLLRGVVAEELVEAYSQQLGLF